MARSRSRGKGGRSPQAKSRKEAPAREAVQVEVVEEGGGLGIDDGVMIVTAILFLVACLLLDKEMASNYGQGWIF